jgi:hypothetical protein
MSPSNKAYNEVKALLGKLDRSIDDARKRRLDTTPRGSTPPASTPQASANPQALLGNGTTKATPAATNTRQSSVFGRAQPIRPTGN